MAKKNSAHVILIDDDNLMLTMMEESIKKMQHEAISFSSAKEALDYLNTENHQTDLIVSDIKMPDISGFEFCKTASNIRSLKNVPILLVSVLNDTESIVEGYNAGCFDYILKPLMMEQFISKCSNAIKQRQTIIKYQETASKAKAVAYEAMENGNKLASIIALSEQGSKITTIAELAKSVFTTLEESNLKSSILFDLHNKQNFFSSNHYMSPLEQETLHHIRHSDKITEDNRYYEFNNRLYASFDKVILLIKNPTEYSQSNLKDYIGAMMNFVDAKAKVIEDTLIRQAERQAEHSQVIKKFGESITELRGIFTAQMENLNNIIDLIMSELSVSFSTLDLGEYHEQVIIEIVKGSLLQLEQRINAGVQTFDQEAKELLTDLKNVLSDTKKPAHQNNYNMPP